MVCLVQKLFFSFFHFDSRQTAFTIMIFLFRPLGDFKQSWNMSCHVDGINTRTQISNLRRINEECKIKMNAWQQNLVLVTSNMIKNQDFPWTRSVVVQTTRNIDWLKIRELIENLYLFVVKSFHIVLLRPLFKDAVCLFVLELTIQLTTVMWSTVSSCLCASWKSKVPLLCYRLLWNSWIQLLCPNELIVIYSNLRKATKSVREVMLKLA